MAVFRQVSRVLFGKGSFDELTQYCSDLGYGEGRVFLLDSGLEKTGLRKRIPLSEGDQFFWVDTTEEPTTVQVDDLVVKVKREGSFPSLILGIGGGCVMDIAKAVSVMLKNPGSSAEYQGWNLVLNAGVPKIGVPTISGTGAEASRTAVLKGPEKKFGINSEYSMFDAIVMDPQLLDTVPNDQRFFTGMDCFIHCVESLNGSFINAVGRGYAKQAYETCIEYFLNGKEDNDELMVASFYGGNSVANSEVGVCHALSYGISLVLGIHHGEANCIVFNQLEEYYCKDVEIFKNMLKKQDIKLKQNVTEGLNEEQLDKMVAMTQRMERPLESALGKNWKEILTRDKILNLYSKM